MEITASKRLQSIGAYAFAEVDKEVEKLKSMGITLRKSSGYPSYIGTPEFRQAIGQWIQKRFGIQLDPATEISSTIGSKEAVFNFPEGIVNPGDYVIIP